MTENKKVGRANLDGTENEELFSSVLTPRDIALDIIGGKMYWVERSFVSNNNESTIYRASLDGSEKEQLVTGTTGAAFARIVLDPASRKMYWTDGGNNVIQRANLDGSQVENVVENVNSPRGIALDAASRKIYWSDPENKKILRANLDGTGIEDFISKTSSHVYDLFYVAQQDAVDIEPLAPTSTLQFQAYPNPFSRKTTLTLKLQHAQQVRVEVFNMLGQRVRVLHEGYMGADITNTLSLDAKGLPNGIYVCRVTGERFYEERSVVLLK